MSGRISDLMSSHSSNHRTPSDVKPGKRGSQVDVKDVSRDELDDVDSCAVTVAVRVRPFAQREVDNSKNRKVVSMQGCETLVQANDSTPAHSFQYDYSFDSFDHNSPNFSSQLKVYECLAQPLLHKAFQGYNTCLFAYGQTGSGKSYSIMGHGEDGGIIPRFAEELFSKIKSLHLDDHDVNAVTVETSFFEIYNEKIHDLLAVSKGPQSNDKATLRVREHPEHGPYVEGLSTFPVASFPDIVKLLTLGNRQRATASTGMNDKSSRSHSVFTMHLTQHKKVELEETHHEHSVVSRINLVDLAGSERQSSANTSGVRLKEGASINKSLLTLGKVISVLAEQAVPGKKRKLFVPYRDSVLTWLLRESLGGNSRTAMLATISPSLLNIEETLSTLRYAHQARSIINSAKVNEDPKARLIRELRAEIAKLRAEQSGGDDINTMQEIVSLRKALQEKEMDMKSQLEDWQRKLTQAEDKLKQESSALEHTGVAATSVNNKLPNLVNLNEDPQLSEILLYVLKQGQTKVGRQGAAGQDCDIQLSGALVSDYHCLLTNEDGQVKITPIDKEAPTFLNGQQINESATLQHGDRVVIGGAHYFRFNCPSGVDPSKRKSSGVPKDFQFAKNEIERVQNERLESERVRMQEEMEKQMAEQLQEVETNYNQQLKDQKLAYESRLQKIQSDMLKQKTQSPIKLETGPSVSSAEQLLSSLRAEKLKLTQSHERLKPKLRSARQDRAVRNIASVPSERDKTDLYKVTLLVREANKLSQIMSMSLVFAQEEVDNVVVVKVTDNNLDRYTHLTVATFEKRLADMREAWDCKESYDDSMAVFCDTKDSWRSSLAPQPQQTTSLEDILSNENKLTSMELVINSAGNGSKAKVRSKSDTLHSVSLFSMCKDFVSYNLQKYKGDSLGAKKVFDSILRQCELCRIAVTSLCDRHKVSGDNEIEEAAGACCLQLVTSSEVLLEQCQLISSMCDDIESKHITDTVNRMSELSHKISRLIVQLMQALSSQVRKAVQDSGASLCTNILELCKLCGVMSLATDTNVTMTTDCSIQLSAPVRVACAKGAVEQCLCAAGEKLNTAQESINYMNKGAKISYASHAIQEATQKVLQEVHGFLKSYREGARSTLNAMECQAEFEACQRYELCSQAMANMGILGDSLSALYKPMFNQGKEYDRAIMLKAANSIKKCCRNIATDSTLDTTQLSAAVSQLFTVTEAEGKVKVHHKSAEVAAGRQVKRLLPQVSNIEKLKRRVLPPSPESSNSTLSPFNNSPPKSVHKLTAMFEGTSS